MRILPALASALVLAAIGFGAITLWMRSVEIDPAGAHVDLRTAERSNNPNDFLAATAGYSAAKPDLTLEPVPDGQALLAKLDRIAQAEPRTLRLAGSPAEGRITWVQRSAVFGFPDTITVEAGPEGWAIWSRARFGRSDLGVNRERVRRWLAALEP